jgi:hypothetical protein
VPYPITWTTISNWARVAVSAASNVLTILGYNRK